MSFTRFPNDSVGKFMGRFCAMSLCVHSLKEDNRYFINLCLGRSLEKR